MQLNLAFLDQSDLPPIPSPASWEQFDESARIAALEILARLIARMLVPSPAREASDE
jgi:hypothetical protein